MNRMPDNPGEIAAHRWLLAGTWERQQMKRYKLHYRGWADFVIQHGEWFQIPSYIPDGVGHGAEKACYGNALWVAYIHGHTYCEGVAYHVFDGPMQHAWNVDQEGRTIDNTWKGLGVGYLGIRFHHGRADDATWRGDATVLNDHNRGWPLLKSPWRGETWGATWEPSPAMNVMDVMKGKVAGMTQEQIREEASRLLKELAV